MTLAITLGALGCLTIPCGLFAWAAVIVGARCPESSPLSGCEGNDGCTRDGDHGPIVLGGAGGRERKAAEAFR